MPDDLIERHRKPSEAFAAASKRMDENRLADGSIDPAFEEDVSERLFEATAIHQEALNRATKHIG